MTGTAHANSRVLEGALHPAQNSRLFGHEQAAGLLARAYRDNQLHHAVSLEGPEGIGKATLAFRFVHNILTNPPEKAPAQLPDPDMQTAVARQLACGASHNLLHLTRPLDPKTGRFGPAIGVDAIRQVGRFLAQTSGNGNWRVVLIDSADDMTIPAANALLKILEEPPVGALFLALSHTPGKLPATIRSRCLRLQLNLLSQTNIRAGLDHLGFTGGQDPATIDIVSARAGGSLARAIVLLRYGGLEIAETFDRALADGPVRGHALAHLLADRLTARERETAYAFFTGYAVERTVAIASDAAMRNDLETAGRLAELATRIDRDLATADEYNLDRKQVVLSIFSSLFGEGTGTGAVSA